MNIGFKSWAQGASAPGSWTTVDVLQCYTRAVRTSYEQAEALDGTIESWRRKRYRVTIVLGRRAMLDSTARSAIEGILDGHYTRIYDTRSSVFTSSNTIALVHDGGAEPARERASNATENLTIELVSTATV